jgi:hypothetical protein
LTYYLSPDTRIPSNNVTTNPNPNANHSAETAPTRDITPDYRFDLPAIERQIRLCRSTLGAILDELEGGDRRPEAVERLSECTTSVIGEIEALWEAIKQSH